MKKIHILFMAILTINCLNAQNWNPISKFETLNYSLGDKLYFTTVWVDSVAYVDADSIYYFNRIAKFLKNSSGSVSEYWLKNQPNYFLSRLRYLPDGDYVFEENDNHKYYIKPHSNVSDNWMFDSANQISALVVKLENGDVFGISDSIKIIKLSNNDTIILSKNYGILKFPLLDEHRQHIDLIGIEGRNLGIMVPRYSDFFNFNIGDVFCYKLASNTRWRGPDIWQKITILDKIIKNGLVSYRTSFMSKTISYDFNNPKAATFIHHPDTVINFFESIDFLDKYPNQFLDLPKNGYTLKPIKFGYDTIFKSITKSYAPNPFCQYLGDTIAGYLNPNLCSTILTDSKVYGVNVGLISSNYSEYNWDPWYIRRSKILVGCIINNQQYGTIFNDQEMTDAVEIGNKSLESVEIYPNPTNYYLIIDNLSVDDNCVITMHNINGIVQFERVSNESKIQLNLTSMQKGLYFLKITNNKSVKVSKIVIN